MAPNSALRLATPVQLQPRPESRLPVVTRAPHARRCTVRVETDSGTFVGKVYVAHGKGRVSDVLSDERPFLNLTDVMVGGSGPAEAFVAINKRYVRTLRVLDEGREAAADDA